MSLTQHREFDKVLIAGIGRSGLAVLDYLLEPTHGTWTALDVITEGPIAPEVRATVADSAFAGKVDFLTFFENTVSGDSELPTELPTYDLCIVSPGIAPSSDFYHLLTEKCSRVISEIEFAFTLRPQSWAAVTGTNGKTTTTALTAHLLRTAGIPAVAVGNIGDAATTAVATQPTGTVFVAEVSSFQLHTVESFRPKACALLNITPDHLNWHGSMEAYTEDKARVFLSMGSGDTVILNADDPLVASYAEKVAQAGSQLVMISTHEQESCKNRPNDFNNEGRLQNIRTSRISRWCEPTELLIKGEHNVSNALAAAELAVAFGAPDDAIRSGLLTFHPIKHRLQLVTTSDGLDWYNDSKATNPDAVLKALSAFPEQPTVLLLGGRNKGSSFEEIAKKVNEMDNVFLVINFGESGTYIDQAFAGSHTEHLCVLTLQEAVDVARERTAVGEAVLLSPGCASFDEFTSFEHRGDEFIRMVSGV